MISSFKLPGSSVSIEQVLTSNRKSNGKHAFHSLEVGKYAGAMIDVVEVGIERGHRIDEIALALRLRADRLALLDRRKAERKVAHRRRRVRIVEEAQRNAPIGDAAVRVGLEYLLEEFLRLAIPERM